MRIPDRTWYDELCLTPRQEGWITAAIILVVIWIGWLGGFLLAGIR